MNKKINFFTLTRIKTLRILGSTISSIALEVDSTTSNVGKICKKANLTERNLKGMKWNTYHKILDDWFLIDKFKAIYNNVGIYWTYEEIASEFWIYVFEVYLLAKKLNARNLLQEF